MKKWLLLATLSMIGLSADYHQPSVGYHIDSRGPDATPEIHLKFEHQSAFDYEDGSIIILHGLSHPYSLKRYHHELGVGYRKLYANFGFGMNFVYANQNSWGFYNHHIVPGIELFYDNFTLCYNRYLPVKTSVLFEDRKYLFHDVSEISLSYRPSKKYEFGVASHFNHQTKRFGFGGEVSAYLFDNWKLAVTPYCEPKSQHGVAFSIAYHFGGARKTANQELKKSHRFFFTSDKKEVEKVEKRGAWVGPYFIPSASPVIMTPAMYDAAGFIIEEPKVVTATTKPNDEKGNWWDWLFSVRTKPKA